MRTRTVASLSDAELVTVTGGMKWENLRQSTNVEDRRTPAGKRRDAKLWDRLPH
jgi:hypothetical protein